MTFGSLFAGIGGFDLGFERSGMRCVWQVEIDDYAARVLAKHWPNVYRERDIRECGKHNLEPVDVICGGFPCQDISYAGRGAGLDGERSGLFFEAVRVVRELRPRIVVLENVAALLTRGLDRVLGTLAEIGYDAEWHCIPAAAVGAPHIRDRIFILAHAMHTGVEERTRGPRSEQKSKDASGAKPRSNGKVQPVANANGERLAKRKRKDANAAGAIRGPESCRSEWWSVEPAVGRVANGVPKRVDRLRGLGNAVVPQVAEWIGRMIINSIFERRIDASTGFATRKPV